MWLRESPDAGAGGRRRGAGPAHLSVRVGIEVGAGVNPVYLAEEAAVADLCLGGRLVFAVRSPTAVCSAETVDVLLAATAARPFRHDGERWQIPANLPDNEVNREDRVRVTPATAQLELPIWLTGPHAAAVARARCLTYVGAAEDHRRAGREWRRQQARLGLAAARLRRVAVRTVADRDAGTSTTRRWSSSCGPTSSAWGMDVVLSACCRSGARPDARPERCSPAGQVMPRVQLDRLPPASRSTGSNDRRRT